jgi:hypothetical protein
MRLIDDQHRAQTAAMARVEDFAQLDQQVQF